MATFTLEEAVTEGQDSFTLEQAQGARKSFSLTEALEAGQTIPGTEIRAGRVAPIIGPDTGPEPIKPTGESAISRAPETVGNFLNDMARGYANVPIEAYNKVSAELGNIMGTSFGQIPTWQKALATPEQVQEHVVNPLVDLQKRYFLGFLANKLPESEGEKGLKKSASTTLSGFTTPEGVATLPLLEFKYGKAALLTLMATHTPAQIEHVATVLDNPRATQAEKWEALGDAGTHLAMTVGLAYSLKPNVVKETMTPEQAAQKAGELPPPQEPTPIQKIETVAPLTAEALKQTVDQPATIDVTKRPPPETPINPGGALADLSPELQAKSNAVKDAMAAEFEALKAKEVKPSGTQEAQTKENVLNEPGALAGQTEAPVSVPKFKVGNNPQTHTIVERLEQSASEKELGEQPVKIKNDKTGEVQTVMEGDLTPVKERAPFEKPVKRDLDAELKEAGLDPSVFRNAAQKREALRREAALKQSFGGAVPEEFENTVSELKQLTKAVTEAAAKDSPLPDRVRMVDRAKDAIGDAKQAVADRFTRMKAIGGAMRDELTKRKPWTDEKEAVGNWTFANQKADFEARQFSKAITRQIPDKLRREAITNWIQADGNEALLKERAAASKGSTKRGYLMALELTPYEQSMARNISQYFESQLQRGQEAGILEAGIENYVNQVWKRDNPVSQSVKYDFSPGKLQPNFKFAKKRIFDSYFEGEQLGFKPATKDIGALISVYDQAFNKSISARGFLKELHEGTASDGRPLVEVAGSGRIVPTEEGKPGNLIITPRSKAADIGDYRVIDHPAMRGWKWVQTMEDGGNVLMQGQLLVHPEAYTKLRNRLQTSAWRTWTVGGIQPGRILLGTQSAVKQTMLSVSGFHQVQETLHALGHRVNPANLEKLNFDSPLVKDLVSHGLQLADYHAMEAFGEGLASGSLLNKVPVVGKRVLKPYTEWLFQDYIPRLKLTMAKHALERNMERYAGKLSRDQILELTSEQANAAFGELNYKYMGRNPNLQDALRAFLLAPDFLEARARFVGQSLKPFGQEQLVALGLLAAAQYVTARIFNKTLDDDYHWHPDDAFTYFYKKKRYSLRTVPGDVIHLFSDPHNFAFNRLSPSMRAGIETVTQRDARGIKRDTMEILKDIAKQPIPISMNVRDDQTLWEAFLNSLGVREYRYPATSEIGELAKDWRKANVKETSYQQTYDPDKDQYRPLRLALERGDKEAAQKAYDKLRKEVAASKISESIRSHYTRSFVGSKANESKFYETLSNDQKKKYAEAKKEMAESLQEFYRIRK